MASDEDFMQQALLLAHNAAAQGEIPVGALLVCDNEIIGKGWNQSIAYHDPSAHAEMMAIRAAAAAIKNYRVVNSTLYVTLEPCLMCVGTLVHARISRLVFGAFDKKTGAVVSQIFGLNLHFHNHTVQFEGGLLAAECGQILSSFFQARRKR